MTELEIEIAKLAVYCGLFMIAILAVIYIAFWALKSNGDNDDFPP